MPGPKKKRRRKSGRLLLMNLSEEGSPVFSIGTKAERSSKIFWQRSTVKQKVKYVRSAYRNI